MCLFGLQLEELQLEWLELQESAVAGSSGWKVGVGVKLFGKTAGAAAAGDVI